MKPLVVMLVAALSLAVGADGHARTRRHHPVRAAAHHARVKAHVTKHRARIRIRRAVTAPRPSADDELALSRSLLEQIQRNLAAGGYYDGAIDGRLTSRTHRALADFQREYHLPVDGRVDRATADALLGRDVVTAAIDRPTS